MNFRLIQKQDLGAIKVKKFTFKVAINLNFTPYLCM